jgi:hypothetical protein
VDRRATNKRRLQDRALFMVETYRSRGLTPPDVPAIDGERVLSAIDIPGDEVTLYLVDAPDADTAERLVLGHGMRPIRVVDVRWQIAGTEFGRVSGKRPM